jgi:hypothetical protein
MFTNHDLIAEALEKRDSGLLAHTLAVRLKAALRDFYSLCDAYDQLSRDCEIGKGKLATQKSKYARLEKRLEAVRKKLGE